jgi:acyl-CoA synthetase (AMP-forming)/AMP-acid ligase II
MAVGDLLREAAASFGACLAVAAEDRTCTYAELQRQVELRMEFLREIGVRAGDRVLLVAETCAEWVALFFAVTSLDATAVMLSARLAPAEIDRVTEHCAPRISIFAAADSAAALAHAERRGARATGVAGSTLWIEKPSRVAAPAAQDPASCAAVIYTSGTTGEPKGAMLSHANLVYAARSSAAARGHAPGDFVYCPLPLAHVGGLCSVMLGVVAGGGCLLLRQRFSLDELIQGLNGGQITMLPGIPSIHLKVLEWARLHPGEFAPRGLRLATTASSPMDLQTKKEVEKIYGSPLQNHYGMTEATATICQTMLGEARADTSVGKPFRGMELRIVDAAEKPVSRGAVGGIEVRGPGVFLGYLGNADATRATFSGDGWLRTGDLGYVNDAGELFIAGRAKDVIKRSGYNIYPPDIEAALYAHPHVALCCVVGRAKGMDEEVVAFVQLKPAAATTPSDLRRFLEERLAGYKLPNVIEVLPSLPTLDSGKLDRASLRRAASSRAFTAI